MEIIVYPKGLLWLTRTYCLIAVLICDYFLPLPQKTKRKGWRITLNTPWEPCDTGPAGRSCTASSQSPLQQLQQMKQQLLESISNSNQTHQMLFPVHTGSKHRWVHSSPWQDSSHQASLLCSGLPQKHEVPLCFFSRCGCGSSKPQPSSNATQGQSQLDLSFVEPLVPWHAKEGMSACDLAAGSKMWLLVGDVTDSGSSEDKAQKWASLIHYTSSGTFCPTFALWYN